MFTAYIYLQGSVVSPLTSIANGSCSRRWEDFDSRSCTITDRHITVGFLMDNGFMDTILDTTPDMTGWFGLLQERRNVMILGFHTWESLSRRARQSGVFER